MCCYVEKAHGTEKTEQRGEAMGYTEVGNWNRYGRKWVQWEYEREKREEGKTQGKGGRERDGENMIDNVDGIWVSGSSSRDNRVALIPLIVWAVPGPISLP